MGIQDRDYWRDRKKSKRSTVLDEQGRHNPWEDIKKLPTHAEVGGLFWIIKLIAFSIAMASIFLMAFLFFTGNISKLRGYKNSILDFTLVDGKLNSSSKKESESFVHEDKAVTEQDKFIEKINDRALEKIDNKGNSFDVASHFKEIAKMEQRIIIEAPPILSVYDQEYRNNAYRLIESDFLFLQKNGADRIRMCYEINKLLEQYLLYKEDQRYKFWLEKKNDIC